MPIKPENRARYPKNWKDIVANVRKRSHGRCEFFIDHNKDPHPKRASPDMYRCIARNREPHPDTGSTVVLTVAHLDHMPENCGMKNLRDACQCCHLRYDREHHAKNSAATRRAKKASGDLFNDR